MRWQVDLSFRSTGDVNTKRYNLTQRTQRHTKYFRKALDKKVPTPPFIGSGTRRAVVTYAYSGVIKLSIPYQSRRCDFLCHLHAVLFAVGQVGAFGGAGSRGVLLGQGHVPACEGPGARHAAQEVWCA